MEYKSQIHVDEMDGVPLTNSWYKIPHSNSNCCGFSKVQFHVFVNSFSRYYNITQIMVISLGRGLRDSKCLQKNTTQI